MYHSFLNSYYEFSLDWECRSIKGLIHIIYYWTVYPTEDSQTRLQVQINMEKVLENITILGELFELSELQESEPSVLSKSLNLLNFQNSLSFKNFLNIELFSNISNFNKVNRDNVINIWTLLLIVLLIELVNSKFDNNYFYYYSIHSSRNRLKLIIT